MIAINTMQRRSFVVAIATMFLGTSAASLACSPPPPPTDYDSRISMVVTPDRPGEMGQGATGRIDFAVELLSSPTVPWIPFLILTRGMTDGSQVLPPGAQQPIRFTAAPDNICPFYEILRSGQFGLTYFYTLYEYITLQSPQSRCSLRFEVLPAATELRSVNFELMAAPEPNNCRWLRDVNPADNTVAFIYGGAATIQAVPTGGRIGWWTMAVALTAVAISGLAARRRKSHRN